MAFLSSFILLDNKTRRNYFTAHYGNSNIDKLVFNQKPNDGFYKDAMIIAGSSSVSLAQEICDYLKIGLSDLQIKRFNDGELSVRINSSCRGKDVYLIQSTCPPVNDNIVELLLTISALRRSSAKSINVVIPYYGYARQDRKMSPRVPISAAEIAKLIEAMGADRVMCVDLHSGQEQGFFNIPVDNLEAQNVAVKYFIKKIKKSSLTNDQFVILSPDAGGVSRAKSFQDNLRLFGQINSDLAIIIKNRDMPGQVSGMQLVGNVHNKHVIIIDDIIDTAGTLKKAVQEIKAHGALSVFCFASHGVFSGQAYHNIQDSEIEQVIVTNTIPKSPGEENFSKINRLSIGNQSIILASLLAEAIRRVQQNESLSYLFSKD